jgi:hypothetical protein
MRRQTVILIFPKLIIHTLCDGSCYDSWLALGTHGSLTADDHKILHSYFTTLYA